MTGEPTLYEVISDVVGEGETDDLELLTVAVFDKIGCPNVWRNWFYPMVLKQVVMRHRRLVRERFGAGDSVVRPIRPLQPHREPVAQSAITRPQFLRDTIETFGVWGRVPFGAMTVEMHESRIAGQLKLASGVKRDVDKHADAINRIKASKVACLNDLPEYGGKVGAA